MDLRLVQKQQPLEYYKDLTFPKTTDVWNYPIKQKFPPFQSTAFKVAIIVPIVFLIAGEFILNVLQMTAGNVIIFGKKVYQQISSTFGKIVSPTKKTSFPKLSFSFRFSFVSYLALAWLAYGIISINQPNPLIGIKEASTYLTKLIIGTFYCSKGGLLIGWCIPYLSIIPYFLIKQINNPSWEKFLNDTQVLTNLISTCASSLAEGFANLYQCFSFFTKSFIDMQLSNTVHPISKGITFVAELFLLIKISYVVIPFLFFKKESGKS